MVLKSVSGKTFVPVSRQSTSLERQAYTCTQLCPSMVPVLKKSLSHQDFALSESPKEGVYMTPSKAQRIPRRGAEKM